MSLARYRVPAAHAAAGPFDGSVPLLCATTEIVECGVTGDCQRRTAPIQRLDRAPGRVILQGGQDGRAWTAVIEADTGKLSAGVVDPNGAFLLFGACTAR